MGPGISWLGRRSAVDQQAMRRSACAPAPCMIDGAGRCRCDAGRWQPAPALAGPASSARAFSQCSAGKPPKCSADIGAIIRVRANRSLMAFFDAIALMASKSMVVAAEHVCDPIGVDPRGSDSTMRILTARSGGGCSAPPQLPPVVLRYRGQRQISGASRVGCSRQRPQWHRWRNRVLRASQ
jgi:hypothetical protein